MRSIRNHVTHEYPDHPELTVLNLNSAITCALALVTYYKNLKTKILSLDLS